MVDMWVMGESLDHEREGSKERVRLPRACVNDASDTCLSRQWQSSSMWYRGFARESLGGFKSGHERSERVSAGAGGSSGVHGAEEGVLGFEWTRRRVASTVGGSGSDGCARRQRWYTLPSLRITRPVSGFTTYSDMVLWKKFTKENIKL